MSRDQAKLVRERLDADGVVAHLRELAATARELEVRIKTAVAHYSEATTLPLDEVGKQLVDGQLVAVQIRFFLDDDWWSDTVLKAAKDFRLVRMREGA